MIATFDPNACLARILKLSDKVAADPSDDYSREWLAESLKNLSCWIKSGGDAPNRRGRK